MEQLSPCATTAEPARLEPVLLNKRGRDSERPAHRDEEWPPLAATRESPCTETKTQHSQQINKLIKIKLKKKKFFQEAQKNIIYIKRTEDFFSLQHSSLHLTINDKIDLNEMCK